MKPEYEVKVWQEGDWWLARVVGASDGADPSPLNALTQARTLTKIESMARDLVATILDAEEDSFDIALDYNLPDDVGELLCQARGARAWLDAAQELWQERSAIAAKALVGKGYSLRETATLLGLSHQRVDQLIGGDVERERSNIWAIQLKGRESAGTFLRGTNTSPIDAVDVLLVVRNAAEHGEECRGRPRELDERLCSHTRDFLRAWASRLSGPEAAAQELEQHDGKVDALHFSGSDCP